MSEPDLEAALKHLRGLPYMPATPIAWDRLQLIQDIKDAVGPYPSAGQCVLVAPGVYGIVVPYGADLLSRRNSTSYEPRLQVYLALREHWTHPDRLVQIGG